MLWVVWILCISGITQSSRLSFYSSIKLPVIKWRILWSTRKRLIVVEEFKNGVELDDEVVDDFEDGFDR